MQFLLQKGCIAVGKAFVIYTCVANNFLKSKCKLTKTRTIFQQNNSGAVLTKVS